ncbi:PucR family transcriptional regulator [Bacillus sp. ISL-37]|uniref:PucR family transcriptional regulator n=1 Tax=Bacillus sp. ISL-37 TaxID=2819123 RepID=UPI001BE8A18D|nr:PucR family transcriptional regulator [Bacillus sp. ISL-37]MBT2686029.1 PucR family transcriptional regulator ligand-binding domain-containing protein [Bacillus sp. ISL-37]
MITIKDILNANVFENSEVLAGSKGLSHEVSTITVAELPDAASWLRGGELVCSTAFFISNQVKHQQEWIESLIHNGASALAIKTSRFLGVVPSGILEVAENNNFPIISLPHEVTWPSVIESFMDFFMNERMKIMRLVEDVQSNLINLMLENKGIGTICDKIASLVGNPIILEDARFQTISVGTADFTDKLSNEQIIDTRVSESFQKKLLQSKFYKNIQTGKIEDQLELTVPDKQRQGVKNITIPIHTNKSVYGFITVIECNKPHSLVDMLVLKNATNALALQLMQQYLNEQTSRTKNLALIEDIIHGKLHTQILYEYESLNISLSDPMVAMMIELSAPKDMNGHFWDRTEEQIYRTIKNGLGKHFRQIVIGNDGSSFTILVSFSQNKTLEITELLRLGLAEVMAELDKHFGQNTFFAGVGGVYSSIDKVGKSYKEANNALSIVKKFTRKGPALFFEDLGIYRIFSMVNDTKEIRDFCEDFLDDLKKYDIENGNILLETLHIYLLSDCGVKETAQRLFLHPNTVAYRIKKIKEIIRYDLDSPEFKMAYLFALESNALLNQ